MNGVVKKSFSLNLKILRSTGLYPHRNHSWLYLIYGSVLLATCLVPDSTFGALYYLKDEELTIMDAGFNLFIIVALISYMPKMAPFIFNNKKIRECVNYLETSVKITLNEKQTLIVDECVWVCRRNTRFFLVSVLTDVISWTFRPLLLSKHEFPMDVWLPFNPEVNIVVYYFIYALVALGVCYTGLVCGVMDPLIGGLAYHAAGQMKVLKDNLEFLYEYAEQEIVDFTKSEVNYDEIKFNIIYRKIQDCIRHHHSIITFVKKIEDCFAWIVFSQFAGSLVLVCSCLLQLSRSEEMDNINVLLMSLYLFSVLVQLYFYCYYGTTVYEESNSLTFGAYLGRWYEYDLKSQKALTIFMERAKVPMTVTAGKLFDLSLTTFTNILKNSYSLLAVLKNY